MNGWNMRSRQLSNKAAQRLLVIGTDCPQIEPSILQAAFDSLLPKSMLCWDRQLMAATI